MQAVKKGLRDRSHSRLDSVNNAYEGNVETARIPTDGGPISARRLTSSTGELSITEGGWIDHILPATCATGRVRLSIMHSLQLAGLGGRRGSEMEQRQRMGGPNLPPPPTACFSVPSLQTTTNWHWTSLLGAWKTPHRDTHHRVTVPRTFHHLFGVLAPSHIIAGRR
jgi:hypothetical protein